MPFWGGSSSGIPPFMVMQEILGGDIKFDGAHWAGISEDAIDFVDKLLDRDFNTRMTAEQVNLDFCWSSCSQHTERPGWHHCTWLLLQAALLWSSHHVVRTMSTPCRRCSTHGW